MAKSSERFESLRRDIDALARRLDVPSVLIMRSLPRHMRVEASAGRLEDTYPIGAEGRKSVHEEGAPPSTANAWSTATPRCTYATRARRRHGPAMRMKSSSA